MFRTLLAILAGAACAIVSVAFLSAYPAPPALLVLPILLIVGLLFSFRFRSAFAAAVAAGIVGDAIANSGGERLLILLATAAAVFVLFTRIITHVSSISFLAMNAIGFAVAGATWLVLRSVSLAFHGIAVSELFTARAARTAGAAIILQTLVAAAVLLGIGMVRRNAVSAPVIRR